MSSESGVVAIEAIQEATKLDTATLDHAMAAQRFEMGVARASESGELSFQEIGQSSHIQQENLRTASIPEVEVHQIAHMHEFGKDIVSYLDGFSLRAKRFASELDSNVARLDASPVPPAVKLAPSSSNSDVSNPASGAPDVFDPSYALRLMQNVYEFSIEAQLLTNAASQSTGIFNGLMKEQ